MVRNCFKCKKKIYWFEAQLLGGKVYCDYCYYKLLEKNLKNEDSWLKRKFSKLIILFKK
jgi:DNA-directed RNA polymerase subunit RPC12/RpoP